MILFVNNNSGILFLSSVITAVARFLKVTSIAVYEYIAQIISAEDSV